MDNSDLSCPAAIMERRNSVAHNTIFMTNLRSHNSGVVAWCGFCGSRTLTREAAHAAAIEISHRYRIKTKGVAGNPASVCPEEMSIFARVKISTPSPDSRSGVLPCAYDDIGVSIPVDIARDGWAGAEPFACGFPRQGEEPVTIFPRMNVYPSC